MFRRNVLAIISIQKLGRMHYENVTDYSGYKDPLRAAKILAAVTVIGAIYLWARTVQDGSSNWDWFIGVEAGVDGAIVAAGNIDVSSSPPFLVVGFEAIAATPAPIGSTPEATPSPVSSSSSSSTVNQVVFTSSLVVGAIAVAYLLVACLPWRRKAREGDRVPPVGDDQSQSISRCSDRN